MPADDPRRSRPGLHTAYAWGPPSRRVQLILLDLRYFRGRFTPSSAEDRRTYAAGRERSLVDQESTETILGEEQWAWLEEQFLEPATVRVVVASFQLAVTGHGFERWGLIPRELQRFYDLVNSTRAEGVVVLSGDRHIGAIYKEEGGREYSVGGVDEGPFRLPYPITEVTASSFTHTWAGNGGADEAGPNRLGPLIHVNNFAIMSFDWERAEITARIHKAEKTQMQREADQGTVLQSVTIPIGELRGADW